MPRPKDGDGNGSVTCDIGAFEVQTPHPTISSFTVDEGRPATRNTAVTLTIAAAGATEMRFSNNNAASWSAWQPFANSTSWTLDSGDGVKTVTAQVRDALQVVSATPSDTITLDTVANAGTVSINALARATNRAAVTLTLTASDAGTGVSEMSFSNTNNGSDWSAWEPFSMTKVWTLSAGADGTRTVYVRVKDGNGNVSPTFADDIVYDTTAPVVSTVVINDGALASTSATVKVALAAPDAGVSEVTEMALSNDGGVTWSPWDTYATARTWILSPGNGPKTVHVAVRDRAGNNSAPLGDTIRLDTSVGTGFGVSINDAATWVNSTSVTLSLPAPARTARMMIGNDGVFTGASREPYDTQKAWTLATFVSGTTMIVYVKFADENNAELPNSRASDTIVLDFEPPTGSLVVGGPASAASLGRNGSASPAPNTPVRTLNLTAWDSQSGSALTMRLSNRSDFAEATWKPFAPSVTRDFTGGNTVYGQFQDGAGNLSQVHSRTIGGGPAPGPGPSCPAGPRPPVGVSVQKLNGTLQVTVSATGANNRLRAVRFDAFTAALGAVKEQVPDSGCREPSREL